MNGSTVGKNVTLTFTTEVGATCSCQLDSGSVINPCSSGQSFIGLTSASGHSVSVTCRDAALNAATATNAFTVDDTAPGVTLGNGPTQGQTVNTADVTYTFAPNPGGEPTPFSYACRFTGEGTFTTCASPYSRTNLTAGTYTLEVHIIDRFGNVGVDTVRTFTVAPLATTFFAIRSGSVAQGTLVRVSTNVRMTAKTAGRFWAQEVDGGVASPGKHGMTIIPSSNAFETDGQMQPGRALTIDGIVRNLTNNMTLDRATFTKGALEVPYDGVPSPNRSIADLAREDNEGMLVAIGGTALTTTCSGFDFCLRTCADSTPEIGAFSDTITSGQLVPGEDHAFIGIVEGTNVGATGYRYWVTSADLQSDVCM